VTHIQIPNVLPVIRYTANGTDLSFAYPFPIFQAGDLEVYFGETKRTYLTDYTVSGAGQTNGGTVTFGSAPAAQTVVTIRRRSIVERIADFQAAGGISSTALNDDLDYFAAILQEHDDQLRNRTVSLTVAEATGASLTIPSARASTLLGFDGAKNLRIYTLAEVAGVSAITSHSALSNLGNDDHTQYLLASGARALTGALNMGGFAIDSVGNVDGVDVSTLSSNYTAHAANVSNPHSVTKTQVGLGEVANLKVKLDATAAPAVTNDAASGYAVGSRWFDITNDKEYVCLDATAGAAVWVETTQSGGAGSGLPTGVAAGAGTSGDALLKFQAQGSSGELQQWKNNAGTDVGGINTDANEQVQIIVKAKTGELGVVLTADLGLQVRSYSSAPGTPGADLVAIYADADGRLKAKDDAGREMWLSADYDQGKSVTTTPYSILATDRTIICSGSADVLNLPAAAGAGKRWEISNYTADNIVINRAGSDTLRKGTTTGATSVTVAAGNTVSIRDIAIGSDEFDVIGQYT
jgi:hypothetical protein